VSWSWLFYFTWREGNSFCHDGCFAVLIAETINTAIEKTVDLVTQERHKLAHIAKDVAAGAVLLTAFYAILVGILVFGPRLWEALLKLSYF